MSSTNVTVHERDLEGAIKHGELDGFKALMDRVSTEKPDPKDLAELRRYLRKYPALIKTLADLAKIAGDDMLSDITSGGLVRATMEEGRDRFMIDLGYQESTPLEGILIETVYLTWLRYTNAERVYTQVIRDGCSFAKANYWERKLTQTHSRHLRSCETLARVRKLTRRTPALQVNIATEGGQQINVA